MYILNLLIILFGLFMICRILLGLILSNIHQISTINQKNGSDQSLSISIIIPAYNEEKDILRCVMSCINSSYHNKQIIVVDDGSTDFTFRILKQIQSRYQKLIIVKQENQGKASAINNGIFNYATGDLIMILDSDSYIENNSLDNIIKHFQNPYLIALSSNVRIIKPKTFIELVQKLEYLLGYRLKGAEQFLGIEYIIGGIGSTFRSEAIKAVGGYDLDSVTEDIDFTMKLISKFGNKQYLFGYADDVIAYTPAVKNFSQLLKQRYRWKYGRFKALFKYKHLMFANDKKYTFNLTWVKLPKIFFEEFVMFMEPFLQLYLAYIVYKYFDSQIVK